MEKENKIRFARIILSAVTLAAAVLVEKNTNLSVGQLLVTLRQLGFLPSQTLVVGDMPFDILMGRGAGTKTCGVTYGNASREELTDSGADYLIDDIAALLDLDWK